MINNHSENIFHPHKTIAAKWNMKYFLTITGRCHLVPLIIQVLDQNIPLGLKRETFDLQRDLHPAKLIDAYAIQVFQLMKLTSFSKKTIINYNFEIIFRGNGI